MPTSDSVIKFRLNSKILKQKRTGQKRIESEKREKTNTHSPNQLNSNHKSNTRQDDTLVQQDETTIQQVMVQVLLRNLFFEENSFD